MTVVRSRRPLLPHAGNLATCNYVYGGDRCYYLDNHSSGIVILGGACIKQRDGGVKINGGKW